MLHYYVAFQVWMATRKPAKGQSLIEYGLILALIAVFCIGALTLMGQKIQAVLEKLTSSIGAATGT